MTDLVITDLTFAAFKAQHADAGFAEWLRARNRDRWDRMIGHRFVCDITSGHMPIDVFLRYLRFEHAFVRTAVTVFGQALVKAPAFEDQVHLIGVLQGLASGQDEFFERAFRTLAPAFDRTDADEWPDGARALSDGAIAIAESGSYEGILSMMLAAEWMYLTWCRAAHGKVGEPVPAEWIALHVEPAFEAQVAWLKAAIDRLGPVLSAGAQEICAQTFGRMLDLEITFHTAPYEAG